MAKSTRDFVVNILGDTKGVDKAFDAFKDNAGKAAAAAVAAFAAAKLGDALSENVETESLNAKLAASLGASAEQSERWGAAAGALYRDAYGENLEQVTGAVEAVASSMAGMREASQEELQKVTASAMNVAEAFDMDVSQATQAAGLLMKSGLAADADEAFDLITASLQKVPKELRGEVMDATREYSQYFAQLGLDGPSAMALLVKASEDGQYAIDKTGDALKELTIRGTDMSTASVDAYEAAGLSAEDMAGKFLAGGEQGAQALSDLVDGLLSIKDPTAQANAAIALFGTPVEDLGTDKIPGFLEALKGAQGGLTDVEGAAARMGDTLNDTASTRAETWRRNIQGFTQDLVDLPGPAGDVALAVSAFGGDALTLAGSLGTAVIALQGMNTAQVKATAQLVASKAVWVATKAATLAGAVATGVATAAQWAWNAAMTANPIGLVVVAIGALVAGLVWAWNNVDWFREGLLAAWDWIKKAAGVFWEYVKKVFSWSPIGLVVQNWSKITDWFRTAWDKIKGFFSGAWDVMKNVFKWTPLGMVIENWSKITDWFRTAWDKIKGFFSSAWDVMKNVFKWTPLGLVIENWDKIIDFFKGIPGKVTKALSGFGTAFAGIFKTAFNAVARFWNDSIGDIGFEIPDWVPGIGGKSWSIPDLPYLAEGGHITSTGWAVVGDAGPEILRLPAGAQVRPLDNGPALGLGGPVEVNLSGAHLTLRVGAREFDAYVDDLVGIQLGRTSSQLRYAGV